MKVLLASRYVERFSEHSNNNVLKQALTLQDTFGINVEMLTWPTNDHWKGPLPLKQCELPPLRTTRENLIYNVFTAPAAWDDNASGNSIDDSAWEAAVNYGMAVLREIKPDVVHLHHRHGFWWILESAQRLSIKTFYTNHDWGLACLRTLFIKGDGTLCAGATSVDHCAACITSGRNLVGKLNETIVKFPLGRVLINGILQTPLEEPLRNLGIVTQATKKRVRTHEKRVRQVFAKLDYCHTPSKFGKNVFLNLGLIPTRIEVIPWYSNLVQDPKRTGSISSTFFRLTFLGRISPEKGLTSILNSLMILRDCIPIQLRIFGDQRSTYGEKLQRMYPKHINNHVIQWCGLANPSDALTDCDALIAPTMGMDNTPLVIVEALSLNIPVITIQNPITEELITEGVNGFMAKFNSTASLAQAIQRSALAKSRLGHLEKPAPTTLTLHQYLAKTVAVYKSIH